MDKISLVERMSAFGSDSIAVFGGAYVGGIHLQQDPEEYADFLLFLLQEKAAGRPLHSVLEIGSATGGNIFCLNAFVGPFLSVVIVDNNQHERFQLRPGVLKDIPRIEVIGDSLSAETISAVHHLANMVLGFDILFIDADHTYEAVKRDFAHYAPCVKEGGVIAFHDSMSYPDVRQLVDELLTDPSRHHVRRLKEFSGRHGIAVFEKVKVALPVP